MFMTVVLCVCVWGGGGLGGVRESILSYLCFQLNSQSVAFLLLLVKK